MSSNVIETRGLTRVYQTYRKPEGVLGSLKGFFSRAYEAKVALHPTDLSIEGGQIIGLVGANGAGKTTLLKLLCGLIEPTGGEARVLGFNPAERKSDYLRQVSILLGQKNQLWWDIPAADSYELLARIYDLDRADAKKRVAELAEMLQCAELLNTQLRRLSLGERMKMEIIGSLLHRPRVLFLDEPTIGLDIVAQTTIREFMDDYVKRERPTIILTSHYMDDISRLADRLLLISQGRIVYDGTVDGFMGTVEPMQKLTLAIATPPSSGVEVAPGVVLTPGQMQFEAEMPSRYIAPAIQKIMSLSAVQDLKIEEANFEDVIRKFLEKESRDRKARDRFPT
jgi:ABC-2 type transport system ATP-binding protein